jgi:plasmid stabilization system protein ParE
VASRFALTPRAVADLAAIWEYIAKDNPGAADRVEAAIFTACARLAGRPMLGSRLADITDLPVRFWSVTSFPNFIVVYRPETDPLQVIAILHGRRERGPLLIGTESGF